MAHKHTAQGVASESEPSYGYKQKSETGNMYEFKLFVSSLSYNYGVNVVSKMLNPSLVILDFQVDAHNRTRSWQLLDTIQLSPVVSSIPLIICTPFMSDIREQEKHLKAHGIVIFYKPFNLDAFVQKVQELLGLSSSKLAVTSRKDVDSQAGRGQRSSPHLQGA